MAKASRKRSCLGSNTRKSVYLWEFLFGLLEDDECATVIKWISKREGVFELKNTEELAKLWGTVKNRPNMNKEKLIRAMRTYYDRGMLKKIKGHKAVYQFLSIPYETDGCSQEIETPANTGTPALVGSPKHTLRDFSMITSNCNERLSGVNPGEIERDNREGTVNDSGLLEDSSDQSNLYLLRPESSSKHSISSDGSSKSLDTLQADLLSIDILEEYMTENVDFVFDDNNNIDYTRIEMC